MIMGAGRPTLFSLDMLEKANSFIDSYDGEIISAAELALHLGVGKRTLYGWVDQFPEFQHTLDKLNALQEVRAIKAGFSGEGNSTICKLLLANHGYSERNQVDNISSDGSMAPPTKIELVAREITTVYDD